MLPRGDWFFFPLVAVNPIELLLKGMLEPSDVGTVGANHQFFPEPQLPRILAEVEGHRQLNAPRRALPPTAQNSETPDREIEYHPPWPFVRAPSQKMYPECAGPPVPG